ncbi:ABC transporter ATP-binding protein [Solirubrobacter sp. CPCC 204708]|uniref:ABC transporter ATP-binding protein n=1 Tax=Solirubrobacter deserti TaxID=2282478 RepID=A0ABT4RT28_9ACTN|nr:ABC transporter ATP-binding protein [Solirubrobacter deserti]MBE2315683.1 ABC transporter ATP-binding protein [Solirubrobacter deserti]MDA0141739.1 ABC transporter ATP-binding protein [Solirubrobacter deserti]
MAVIEVTDLRCTYGAHTAVDGVDFSVERGEVFALLGANGAGKTTTLEALEGHHAPAGGRVRVFGHDPRAERRAVRRRTGVMLQDGGFAGELTVRETAELWARLGSRAGDVAHDLERLDLTARADVAVEQLSGGERRRLEVALAIHGSPDLLVLDEPTTGLDPESRRRTWQLIGELVDAGTTILLTTHYLEEAEALAHRVAILRDGRIVRAGSLGDVSAALPARISFRAPPHPLPDDLAALRTHGRLGELVLETHHLQRDLRRLLNWADTHDLTLERLHARGGTLEDAFLGVIA